MYNECAIVSRADIKAQIDNGQMSAYEGAVETYNRRNILLKEIRVQSNFYISLVDGTGTS